MVLRLLTPLPRLLHSSMTVSRLPSPEMSSPPLLPSLNSWPCCSFEKSEVSAGELLPDSISRLHHSVCSALSPDNVGRLSCFIQRRLFPCLPGLHFLLPPQQHDLAITILLPGIINFLFSVESFTLACKRCEFNSPKIDIYPETFLSLLLPPALAAFSLYSFTELPAHLYIAEYSYLLSETFPDQLLEILSPSLSVTCPVLFFP